jgi:hypothetical protein
MLQEFVASVSSPPPVTSAPNATVQERAEASAQVSAVPMPQADSDIVIASEARIRMIEEAAYYRAEKRGFVPGQEVDDWVKAEAEIDRVLGCVAE